MNRCSFCIAKNQAVCHYSVRRPTGPRPDSARRRASKVFPGKAGTATTRPSRDLIDSGGSSGLISGSHCPTKLLLQRACLTPSPATGLIGLRENAYIADFFRTLGFLPFVSESFIRKAMVKTMFCAMQKRNPGLRGRSAGIDGVHVGEEVEEEEEEEEAEDEEEDGCGEGADVPGTGLGAAVESAAATCVLWCTVAVGCLIGGRPKSSADGYARLARDALSGCFDDMSVQTARAFTSMALLQDMRGNEGTFSRYIDSAKWIMRVLPPEEVPTELRDVHMIFKSCDLLDGFYHELGEEDLKDAMGAAMGQAEEPLPSQQAELCRWLLKTDVRSLACFSMDLHNSGFLGYLSKAETHTPFPGPETESSSRYDQVPGAGSGLDTHAPRVCCRRRLSSTSADPPPLGPISQKFAARILRDVNVMMHVTQSPDVCGGIGKLYFWKTTAYACLLQGQLDNAVEGFLRCTDIMVRNPGMCRFSSWKHLVHHCLACMAISGNADKYEELRASLNSVVDIGAPRAPPFEEYRGMRSICGNIFCRSVDAVFVAIAALVGKPSDHCGDTPAKINNQEDRTPCSSAALEASCARGVFDKCQQPKEAEGALGNLPPLFGYTAAAAAAAPAAAFGFGGAYGCSVGSGQHPRDMGVAFGFGTAAGSAGSITDSSLRSSVRSSITSTISSKSVGPSPADVATVVTAAPWARQDGNSGSGQPAGGWFAPLHLLSAVPSARTTSAAVPVPADVGVLGLPHHSELEGAEAAGLLDAADELLGVDVLEVFEEGVSEEDTLRFSGENA
eukprot:g13214.t1